MTQKTLLHPTASQASIIEAARRYRVVTPTSLHAMLEGFSPAAAEKALRRLERRGWLHQVRLPERRSCYTLSRQAVLALGLSKKAKKAMGQAAVITNLAMIHFCARQKVERLTPEELMATYPDLDKPGQQLGNYYSDYSVSPPRLTWMLVDRAFAPDALLRKIGKVVKRAYRFPSLTQLVQVGQFAVVVLVPNERKQWLVERTLAKRFFTNVPVSVQVIPEIQSLLLS